MARGALGNGIEVGAWIGRNEMTSMQDKLVLVTGAGRGLGAAIAAGFAREGARLIVADLDAALATASAQAIRDAGGRAVEATLDVTDADAVRVFAADCAARHGNIDVLVNNAGISARAAFDDPQTPEIWDRLMGVNLQGAFNVTHAFVEQLKAARGAIVNLCSIVAYGCGISTAGYVVSKGGVRSFTEVLARDLAPHGVRVNAVAPGLMETDMTAGQRAQDHGTDWYMRRAPMARRPRRRDRRPGPVPGLGHGQLCERRGATRGRRLPGRIGDIMNASSPTPAAAGAPKASPGKALVTGGASGIGLAIVERLARDGYAVVMADRNGELAAREAAALRAQGLDVEHRVVDLADEAATRALARELAPWPRWSTTPGCSTSASSSTCPATTTAACTR